MTAQTVQRLYDKNGRERVRAQRCPYDRAVLSERAGLVWCPECGKTPAEMAQVPR